VKEIDLRPSRLPVVVKPTCWLAAGSLTIMWLRPASLQPASWNVTKIRLATSQKNKTNCRRWPDVEVETGNGKFWVL